MPGIVGEPHWTAYVTALGTPIVALTAAFIAGLLQWRQARIARNKLILDLFDRRFPLYQATQDLFGTIFVHGKATDEDFTKYLWSVRTARWLFDAKLAEYLKTIIGKKVEQLITLNSEFETLTSAERHKNLANQSELKKWFDREYEALDGRFRNFLQLRH